MRISASARFVLLLPLGPIPGGDRFPWPLHKLPGSGKRDSGEGFLFGEGPFQLFPIRNMGPRRQGGSPPSDGANRQKWFPCFCARPGGNLEDKAVGRIFSRLSRLHD